MFLIIIFMKGGLIGYRMFEYRFEFFIVLFCVFLNVDILYIGLLVIIF